MQRPSASLRHSAPQPHNTNPLSAQGTLGMFEFVVTLAILTALQFGFSWFIHQKLAGARYAAEFKPAIKLYAVWFVFSSVGFLMITNTFIKRWTTILNLVEIPGLLRTLARFVLLSPLLSIWATIMTLMFGPSSVFQEGGTRARVLLAAVVSLAAFHLCFLGYQIRTGVITLSSTEGLHFRSEATSPGGSLWRKVAKQKANKWMPDEKFFLHVYPYLDPGGKYGLSLMTDYRRAEALSEDIQSPNSILCESSASVRLLGAKVPDCFMANYKTLAEGRPFATPAIGFMYETKYRQASMERFKDQLKEPGASPLAGLASALLTLRNTVELIEPNPTVLSRSSFFEPKGLLGFYGSPELPMMEFGQDLQNYLLTTKIVPLLTPQMLEIEKALRNGAGALEPKLAQEAQAEVDSLKERIARLERDPLRLTWTPAEPLRSVGPAAADPAQ